MKKMTLGILSLFAYSLMTGNSFATDFRGLKSWGYQLHSYLPEHMQRMESSTNTLWVIDYSKDGSEGQKFSSAEIAKIKRNGNTVISYFCLGESEKARFYWPTFDRQALIKKGEVASVGYKNEVLNFSMEDGVQVLGRDNAEYVDNFPVKYWLPSWQKIMVEDSTEMGLSYLNRVMNAGLDGIYLDTVDAFEYYNEGTIETRAKQMYAFILKIAKTARARNPNFKIMMQNAMSLTDYLSESEKTTLFSYVKGFGVEDLFHPGVGENNPRKFSKFGEFKSIEQIRKKFKDVTFFTVDYIPGLTLAEQKDYFKDARKKDLVPLISDRSLSGKMIVSKP